MKTIFTSIVLSIFALQLYAQTFTYSVFSNSLSSTTSFVLANNSSFNLSLTTTTGNNVSWNASALTQQLSTPTINFVYVNSATTPYSSLFAGSNYAQYDPALIALLGYKYFKITADSLTSFGEYNQSGSHEIYQDPDKSLIFPFSYGQTFTDNYAKTNYSNATTVSSYQNGIRTVTFNGYGTLILPQGTFTNVALISEMRTNNLGPNSTTFSWWDIINGKQLLLYSENNGSITTAFTTASPTTINEIHSTSNAEFFPNPVTSSSTLRLENINLNQAYNLTIFDAVGNKIKSIPVNSKELKINCEDLSEGIYFYNIISGKDCIKTGKFVIN